MFSRFSTILFITALIAGIGFCEDEEKARLLAKKSVLNNLLVEGKELNVQYTIYNVGSGCVINISAIFNWLYSFQTIF